MIIFQIFVAFGFSTNCLDFAQKTLKENNNYYNLTNFVAYLAMPYAHFGYENPSSDGQISSFSLYDFFLNNVTQYYYDCKSHPDQPCNLHQGPDTLAKNLSDHPYFKEYCPMYLKSTQKTCAIFNYGDPKKDKDYLGLTNIENEYNNYLFEIYPRCYNLIHRLPCALFHPYLSDMYFQVGKFDNTARYNQTSLIFSFPLCGSYAEKIYYECRHAYYSKLGERKLIVPKDFSLEGFKKLVKTPEEENVSTCIDENFASYSPFVMKPQIILIFATILISLFSI